jgi:hypothetical protein
MTDAVRDEPAAAATSVRVVEPRFRGARHSRFNAALLLATIHGFPGHSIEFAAHPSHIDWVKRALPGDAVDRVRHWTPLRGLPRLQRAGRLRRAIAELATYSTALGWGPRPRAGSVVLCSVTKLGIAVLKTASFLGAPPTLAIVHQLFQIAEEEGRFVRRLDRLLSLPHRAGVRFAVPGGAAVARLRAERPRLAKRLLDLEPPYVWQRHRVPDPRLEGPLCFGLFGTASAERLEPFVALSRRFRSAPVRFRVVGHLPAGTRLDPDDDAALGYPPREPLTTEEMAERADEVDLAIWSSRAKSNLRFSASFLDCLSFVKPLIALRTPFIEHYFDEMGEIGILCDDDAELESAVRGLVADLSPARYRSWCTSILTSRGRFDAAAVGEHLHRLLGGRSGGGR